MVRVRLPVAAWPNAFGAAAPTFTMVPGSFLPVTPGVLGADGPPPGVLIAALAGVNPTVLVDVPDEDCTNGALDPAKVKARYPNHPLVVNGTIK